MKIELRGISVNSHLSEENFCFSATLVVDGKVVGTVSNRGHGGCDDVRLKPDCGLTEKEIDEAVAKSYPGTDTTSMGVPGIMEASLESVCAVLVSKHLIAQDVKRKMKRKIVVVEDGKLYEYGWKGCKAITPQHVEAFKRTNPDKVMLNTMTAAQFEAALAALPA